MVLSGYTQSGETSMLHGPGMARMRWAGSLGLLLVPLIAGPVLAQAPELVRLPVHLSDTGLQAVDDVAVDSEDNLYAAGRFMGTVDFDPGPGITSLTSAGERDIFVLKLDSKGTLKWALRIGGAAHDSAARLALDATGSALYVVGRFFSQSVDFDPGSGEALETTISIDGDAFVLQLHSDGTFGWVSRLTSVTTGAYSAAVGVAVGSSGVFAVGAFSGEVDFDPGENSHSLMGGSNNAAFVWKLNAVGSLLWAKHVEGSDSGAISVALNGTTGVIAVGSFSGAGDFNPDPADTLTLTSVGNSSNAFFWNLDGSTGSLVWAKQVEGESIADDVSVDQNGNSYSVGLFGGTVDFDPGLDTENATALTRDGYVLKLGAQGDLVWVHPLASTDDVSGSRLLGVSLDAVGNALAAGTFSGTVDFEPPTSELGTAVGDDGLIIGLDASGTLQWTRQASGGSVSPRAIIHDGSGRIHTSGRFYDTVDFDPTSGVVELTANGGAPGEDGFIWTLGPKPVVQGTKQYCITGTSSGQAYSWWIDVGDDSLGITVEPHDLNADSVLPVGSSPEDLAAALASQIHADAQSLSLGVDTTLSGSCLTVLAPVGVCVSGVCYGGLLPGVACVTNAQCTTVISLRVGEANVAPACKVTTVGCSYNPVIRLMDPESIPVLDYRGVLILAGLILSGGYWLLRRRSRALSR